MSLKRLKDMGGKRIDLEELPKEIDAIVETYEFKPDIRGKECLYLHLQTNEVEPRKFTQKYSSLHIGDLADALEKLKYKSVEDLTKRYHHWRLMDYRIGKPRLIPIKKVE